MISITTHTLSAVKKRVLGTFSEEYTIRDAVRGIAYALPYLIVFTIFMVYPLVKGFYISLFEWNALFPSQSEFVGLQNYASLLADPLFWKSLKNTLIFVLIITPSRVVLSLLLALGVNRKIKGKWILRTVFFSPYILTVSVVGLLWTDLFQSSGLVNTYLGLVMANPPDWLVQPIPAVVAVAIASIWWTMAFDFVIFLAARQKVPERLYEAAKLDGASSWRMAKDITLPQMRNPMLFVVVTSFIQSFQIFGQPYIMTGGGPVNSTLSIVMYLYESGFTNREFGYGAAVGYVLFLILITVSLINYYAIGVDDNA